MGRRLAAAAVSIPKSSNTADVEVGSGYAADDKHMKYAAGRKRYRDVLIFISLPIIAITLIFLSPKFLLTTVPLNSHVVNQVGSPPLLSSVDEDCLTKIRTFLTASEISGSLDTILCSTPSFSASSSSSSSSSKATLLADLVIQDRSKVRKLERREYLKDLRSYRLSGLICDNHQDKSIPPVASEPAFRCLTSDYKRRACMDGRVDWPKACNDFKGSTGEPYIPEPEREQKKTQQQQKYIKDYPKECQESSFKANELCHEPLMAYGDGTSEGQLAVGVPEAKVLTKSILIASRPVWRKEALDFHLTLIKQGKNVGPKDYPGSHQALQRAMEVVNVKGKSVAIFGSISPWVESLVHFNGAQSPTMTVDYNQPISYDERMETELMTTMLENENQFDIIVSYSSIEHDGQGRYGDPLDPDGDLAAMKECWLKVSPGGYFLLHVPFSGQGADKFHWFSMRTYGSSRLPLLIRGWEYMGLVTSKKVYGRNDVFNLMEDAPNSPVLILRKPQTVGVHELLDTSKFGGLSCDVKSKKCAQSQ